MGASIKETEAPISNTASNKASRTKDSEKVSAKVSAKVPAKDSQKVSAKESAKITTKGSSKSPARKDQENSSANEKLDDCARLQKLLSFDKEMTRKWVKRQGAILIGTDEVGRGCLAGPVVAAAVHLGDLITNEELHSSLESLNDSKKMLPQKREELAAIIKANCRYAIAEASVEEIEKLNILRASLLAMKRAMAELAPSQGTVILIDGNKTMDSVTLRQIAVIGGDGISASIAAASIIAKVYRDQLMQDLHNQHPQYRWDSNKGYGSKDHRDAIQEHGITSWHRRAFCAKFQAEQLSLLN